MKQLSLIQLSNAVSAQRGLNDHHGIGIKCFCTSTGDDHRGNHEPIYDRND